MVYTVVPCMTKVMKYSCFVLQQKDLNHFGLVIKISVSLKHLKHYLKSDFVQTFKSEFDNKLNVDSSS